MGLPIARAVAILSLATACVMDAVIGPYKGKETGETALLRSILSSLQAGDIAVFDRCYCSFMMIALLQLQGTDVFDRLHQKRRRFSQGQEVIFSLRPYRFVRYAIISAAITVIGIALIPFVSLWAVIVKRRYHYWLTNKRVVWCHGFIG